MGKLTSSGGVRGYTSFINKHWLTLIQAAQGHGGGSISWLKVGADYDLYVMPDLFPFDMELERPSDPAYPEFIIQKPDLYHKGDFSKLVDW